MSDDRASRGDAPPASQPSVRTRRLPQPIALALRVAILGYVMWLGALGCMQERLLYPGAYAQLAPAEPRPNLNIERFWVQTDPGVKVEGWFIAGRGATPETPGPAVLIAHGNYEVIDQGEYFAEQYAAMGFSVLLAEFRGYGRSGGRPSEAGITRDFVAFHEWLSARAEVDPKRIVYYGRSIGGAAVAQLAARRPPAAIILESAFGSMDRMAGRFLIPSLLVRDHWRTDEAIANLGVPLLLIHGRGDPTIPVSESRWLHELCKGSELLEYDGGHTDLAGGNARKYWGAVREFLKRCGVRP